MGSTHKKKQVTEMTGAELDKVMSGAVLKGILGAMAILFLVMTILGGIITIAGGASLAALAASSELQPVPPQGSFYTSQ